MLEASASHICPFYRRETKQAIFCEGLTAKSELQNGFVSTKDLRDHKKLYCNGCFFRCPNAIMLNRDRPRFLISICKYNAAVECDDSSKCESCGWQHEVAKKRLQQFLQTSK